MSANERLRPTGWREAAAAVLVENSTLRMPIIGRSMAPSVVAPMVLQIGPAHRVRIGDILVFRKEESHVAHRVIAYSSDGYATSGDAQPHVVERVVRGSVVGRVDVIWSDASANARRVNAFAYQLRSWYFGRLHPIRCRLRLGRDGAIALLRRLWPQRRPRFTRHLVEALRAAQANDAPALLAALQLYGSTAYTATDVRHRCAALLGEAARRLDIVSALPAPVATQLRAARLSTMLGSTHMYRAIANTAAILQNAGIEFALLKGAARLVNGTAEGAYHSSDDIDILVRPGDMDAALTAFAAGGWQHRDSPDDVRRFRSEHHHAASLFPPDGRYPVEIHRFLARPGTISTETDWDALQPFFTPLPDSAPFACLHLDRVGTAFHLAIHSIGLTRLRDIALLARVLPTLNAEERSTLRTLTSSDRLNRIRLEASLALAAYIAGIEWPVDRRVERYIRWALRREDLPLGLRLRNEAAELYYARLDAPWLCLRALIPWWSRGAQWVAAPGRIVGRCAANAAAVLYAHLLPPAGTNRFS